MNDITDDQREGPGTLDAPFDDLHAADLGALGGERLYGHATYPLPTGAALRVRAVERARGRVRFWPVCVRADALGDATRRGAFAASLLVGLS